MRRASILALFVAALLTSGVALAITAFDGSTPRDVKASPSDFSRGGCATSTGCAAPDGGMWLVDSLLWDSDPGVWDQTSGGTYFDAGSGAVSGTTDAISTATTWSAITIPNTVAGASCGTGGDSTVTWCTSITGAVADADDPKFCRNSTTPYAVCGANGAGCSGTNTSVITGANDPMPIIVRVPSTQGGTDYGYFGAMVTGYAGCTGSTNTLTVQPFPIESLWADGNDAWMPAMDNQYHPSSFYGQYVANQVLTGTTDTHYVPHNNMAAAYNTDVGATDCPDDSTVWTKTGTVTISAIGFDPTKAPWLGSYSSVRGNACKFVWTTGVNAVTSQAITVQGGTWYSIRIKLGSAGTGTAPKIEVLDQAGADYDLTFIATVTRGFLSGYGAGPSVTLSQNEIGGWSTLFVKFYVPALSTIAAQTARLKITFNQASAAGTHYIDDFTMWPSTDQLSTYSSSLSYQYMIPYGFTGKILVLSDSRGLSSHMDLAAAMRTQMAYARPDMHATIVDNSVNGRTISGVGYQDDWKALAKGYDYVVVLLGVNDAISGHAAPYDLAKSILNAEAGIKRAGAIPIWVREPPVISNSATIPATACSADGVTGLRCANVFEQVFRSLVRGGAIN